MKLYTKVLLLVPTKTFLLLQKGSTGSDLIKKHFILVKNKQQLDSLFRLRSEIFKDSSAFTQRRDMNNLITSTAKKKKSYNGTVCICMCVCVCEYLQSVTKDPHRRPRSSSTGHIQLRCVFIGQISDLSQTGEQWATQTKTTSPRLKK